MDPARFDQISKRFAARRLSRRRTLRGLGAIGIAGALLGLRREHAAADCADINYCNAPCVWDGRLCKYSRLYLPSGPVGACWDWNTFSCNPCHTTWADLAASCNQQYWECQGTCTASPTPDT